MTKREAGIWLAAAIDGEGHVRRESNEVTIVNTSREFIEHAVACADLLGVDSVFVGTTPRTDRKSIYTLQIFGWRNCAKLRDACPLVIPEKRERLQRASRDKRFDRCEEDCRCGRHTYYPRRSKPRGVSWNDSRKRFRAYHRVEGQQIHLGWFKEEEDALEAARAFRASL